MILAMLLLLTTPPLDLHVTPTLGMGPLVARVSVTVEPSDLNHQLCIEWVSENYSGSSCQSVNGAKFARTTNQLLGLTSGDYTFQATLHRSDGHDIHSPRVEVHVQ